MSRSVLASGLDVAPVDAKAMLTHAGRAVATTGDGANFPHLGSHVLLDPAYAILMPPSVMFAVRWIYRGFYPKRNVQV